MPVESLNIQTVGELNTLLDNAKNGRLNSQQAISANNAGVEYVIDSNVYPVNNRNAQVVGTATSGFTFTKNVEASNYTWYAVKIAIDYDNITDLDRGFSLGYKAVSGQAATTMVIVDGAMTDWNPIHNPIIMSDKITATSINLYDIIVASDKQSVYESLNTLYITLAYFNPDNTVPPSLSSVWEVKPNFEVVGSEVIATKNSAALSNKLTTAITSSVSGLKIPKQPYLSHGIGNGDSTNSTMIVTPFLDTNGQTIGYKDTLQYSGTSYLYSWHKIADVYSAIATKKFKLVIKSDVAASFIFRMLAGGSWSTGHYNTQTVTLNEANNFTTTIEIDMSAQNIADFYAIANKPQLVVFAFVWENSSDRHKINLYTQYYDEADVATLESEAESAYINVVDEDLNSVLATVATVEQTAQSLSQYVTDKIVCWGDSLTAGGGWTSTLATLTGLPVYNGGTGGESSKTIVARQGGDVMQVNNITIPATTTPVIIADRDVDTGIDTYFGNKVTPLLQGGAHVNPVMIGDVEGTLSWTGSSYSDMTGDWTFTRSVAGSEVVVTRPTAIRTNYDRNYNNGVLVLFMGQNGGYTNIADLILQHKRMIAHSNAKEFLVLGLSSGSASARADYESAMELEFGRNFVSLRKYLAAPIYAVDGTTIISCYGLDDAGLTPTQADLDAIATGTVPPQLLADSVHYTTATKTVIGNMLFKRMSELGMLP